jgi:DNA-binding protein HU-beta
MITKISLSLPPERGNVEEFYILHMFTNLNLFSMNKTDFIGAVAKNAGLSKVDAKKSVEAFIKTVEGAVKKGEKVSLLGFGSFSVVEKAARKGVNPKTKKPINIPARKIVKFKPGTGLAKGVK